MRATGSQDGSEPPFFLRYGISRAGDPGAPTVVEPSIWSCRGGVLRPTVLAALVDVVGIRIAREIAGPDALLTTADLSVRAPARLAPKRIVARGELLRAGSTALTSEVLLDADGQRFAYGQASFRRLAPAERSERPGLAESARSGAIDPVPLERPLAVEAGVVVADAGRGRVELPLRDALISPQGVMQGGLVALVVEEAALALAEHGAAGRHVVTELDVRYLAAGRTGPIASSACWVADRESAMVRIALRDVGHGDRITAAALARVAPAPGEDAPSRRNG